MRLLLLLPVLSVLLLASCGGQPAAAGGGGGMPAPQVGVASPIERELPVLRELTGAVEAMQTVQIMPKVGGEIVKVAVQDGAEVKAGDILVQIDRKPFQVALENAQAAVHSAQARLEDATANLKRSRPLLPQHAISEQQLADLEAADHVAAAQLESAKAGVDSAQLNLSWTQVVAPISGRIGKLLATVGNLVVAGGAFPGTVITTLVGQDPLYVGFDLDEETWRAIGGHLRSSGEGGSQVPVSVQLAGEQGFPHQGYVAFADNQIDSGSGSIRVRARLPNPDRLLTPGAFARVQLEASPARPVLLINESALQSQLATQYVLSVDDKGVTGFRPVTLGQHFGQLVEVASGLGKDDRIVVTGLAKIFFPGMPVSAQPVAMEDPLGEHTGAVEVPGTPAPAPPAAAGDAPASPAAGAAAPAATAPAAAAQPGGAAKP